jgi:hypothetical protein
MTISRASNAFPRVTDHSAESVAGTISPPSADQHHFELAAVEAFEIDAADEVTAGDLRQTALRRVFRPRSGQQERVTGIEQTLDQHRRGLVQQRQIVDEQHEPTRTRPLAH